MGAMRNGYRILVGKPEGKRPLGEPRSEWENNTTMTLMGKGWEGVSWIHMTQDGGQRRATVNTAMNFQIP
jgi:hypothetical protein